MGVSSVPAVTLAENPGIDYGGSRPLAADWVNARLGGEMSITARQVFEQSGTFTPRPGVSRVFITMIGGGAGGKPGTIGAGSAANMGGAGGGAAKITYQRKVAVEQIDYAVTVGAGGGSNVKGGNSSFAQLLTAAGGVLEGGSAGSTSSGGRGESSFFGSGGNGGGYDSNGGAAVAFGAGGGGGGAKLQSSPQGGAGKSGIVIIEW